LAKTVKAFAGLLSVAGATEHCAFGAVENEIADNACGGTLKLSGVADGEPCRFPGCA
jgi:hypothetical protein